MNLDLSGGRGLTAVPFLESRNISTVELTWKGAVRTVTTHQQVRGESTGSTVQTTGSHQDECSSQTYQEQIKRKWSCRRRSQHSLTLYQSCSPAPSIMKLTILVTHPELQDFVCRVVVQSRYIPGPFQVQSILVHSIFTVKIPFKYLKFK